MAQKAEIIFSLVLCRRYLLTPALEVGDIRPVYRREKKGLTEGMFIWGWESQHQYFFIKNFPLIFNCGKLTCREIGHFNHFWMYNSMALIVFTLLCAHQQTPSISRIFFVLENGQELQNKKMQMNKKKKKKKIILPGRDAKERSSFFFF